MKKISFDSRAEYTHGQLLESEAAADPFDQFGGWIAEAEKKGERFANAMALATVTPEGKPASRFVLLKSVDERGFVFFTHYDSPKARDLGTTPYAALLFFWASLERQVRIEGLVSRLPADESDRYFGSRPRSAQLAAWTSRQSLVISGREVLETSLQRLEQEYRDREIPRPSDWGGYRLTAKVFEFWQGRPDRLNDRLRYRLGRDDRWKSERLSP